MTQHIEILAAAQDDLPEVEAFLQESQLPTQGLAAHWETLFLGWAGHQLAGSAAVEVYGTEGLLRSVAVHPDYRGQGLGARLTRTALAAAQNAGVTRIFLLTETAAAYFPRFGFDPIERDQVHSSVKKSAEFSGACPDSAQAMAFTLAEGRGHEWRNL